MRARAEAARATAEAVGATIEAAKTALAAAVREEMAMEKEKLMEQQITATCPDPLPATMVVVSSPGQLR